MGGPTLSLTEKLRETFAGAVDSFCQNDQGYKRAHAVVVEAVNYLNTQKALWSKAGDGDFFRVDPLMMGVGAVVYRFDDYQPFYHVKSKERSKECSTFEFVSVDHETMIHQPAHAYAIKSLENHGRVIPIDYNSSFDCAQVGETVVGYQSSDFDQQLAHVVVTATLKHLLTPQEYQSLRHHQGLTVQPDIAL